MLLAGSEALGIEASIIPKAASALGAGLCYSGDICGIAAGGLIVIGLIHGRENPYDDNSTAYRLGRSYIKGFERLAGALSCRLITGCDFTREEDRQYFDDKLQSELCAPLLVRGIKLLNEIILNE